MSSKDKEILKLKDKLYQANLAIVEIMPEELQDILMSFFHCKTKKHLAVWQRKIADQIVELAKEVYDAKTFSAKGRAYCPLCRKGSSSPYAIGFAIPEGLRNHLLGHCNTVQCSVTKAAFELAKEALCNQIKDNETKEKPIDGTT